MSFIFRTNWSFSADAFARMLRSVVFGIDWLGITSALRRPRIGPPRAARGATARASSKTFRPSGAQITSPGKPRCRARAMPRQSSGAIASFLPLAAKRLRERLLHCFDRLTGKLLWEQLVLQSPLEDKHQLPNSFASSRHRWAADLRDVFGSGRNGGGGLRFFGPSGMAGSPGRVFEQAWLLQLPSLRTA